LSKSSSAGRITEAWYQCKEWITIDDGSATEIFFLNIPAERFFLAMPNIIQADSDYELDAWDERADNSIHTLQELERSWLEETCRQCSIDYVTTISDFRFCPRLLVDRYSHELLDIDMVFQSREVFLPTFQHKPRFDFLFNYVFQLQAGLHSNCVVVGPENSEDPRKPYSDFWTII